MANLSREEIGEIGEALISTFFEQYGHSVILSEDRYDTEKDMVIDGKNVEVKTQTVYRLFPCEDGTRNPAFTVPVSYNHGKVYTNQLNKCLTVDRLIFVARPGKYDDVIRFYEAPPPGQRTFQLTVNKNDARIVAGFMLSDMKEIGICSNKKAVEKLKDGWKYQ